MNTFSKNFNLNKNQHELDFVDVDPKRDIPLFIDPYAISINEDGFSTQCNLYIISFFQTALDYIRSGRATEAKELLNNLNEPNETCFGVSNSLPSGRGVSGKQALDIYNKLAESQAAKSGILSELAECDLFIEGIAQDKISDITTNIIRGLLIEYTQKQCELHEIVLNGKVASGKLWDINKKTWHQTYVQLPIIDEKKIILVPKYIVRFKACLDSHEYYNHFVLNFLQQEHLNANSSLIHVLKNGKRKVYKKDLKELHPFNKEWLAEFTNKNPDVLKKYKNKVKNSSDNKNRDNSELNEEINEILIATEMISSLKEIEAGAKKATAYQNFLIGVLEFILWPNLIYPIAEHKIHEGRKRIDITYTNAAKQGFFNRIHTAHHIASNLVMVECKNYNKEINNPELDQLSSRFSVNRGKFGFLLYRNTDDYDRLLKICKDTASDGRGFIIPLGDHQIIELLSLIENDKRSDIDKYLDRIFVKIIS